MKYLAFFPTLIFHGDLLNFEEINSKLLKSVEVLQQTNPGIQKSNIKGWHSDDTILLHHPDFKFLIEAITVAYQDVLKDLSWDLKLKISNCWVTVSPPGSSNARHSHPGSLLSGVYYIKAQEGASSLHIHDPRPVKVHSNPQVTHTSLTSDTIALNPKSGRIYIFPGWLEHSVPENTSSEDRVVFSFNLISV